ncbi:MAG TPA: hypothetical protein VN706_12515 [Gemmatimonadaceae bacterium]|nr:hypothetical protein [Gemmatimonadaceae bacterium]
MKPHLDRPDTPKYNASTAAVLPAHRAPLLYRVTDAARRWFDVASQRTSPAFVVIVAAAIAVGTALLTNAMITSGCLNLPVPLMRLEVSFSASRFAALLGAEGACRNGVISSILPDGLFSVGYALALSTTYLWAERWRRYEAGDDWRPVHAQTDKHRRRLFIVLPLVAAAIDLTIENVPLWLAGRSIGFSPAGATSSIPTGVGAAVVIGSIGASLKWLLVLGSIWSIAAELLSGPRGIVLRRLRFSVLAVALGALPLLLVGQGQDILQRVSEGDHRVIHTLESVLAIAFASTMVWYCGRRLMQLGLDAKSEQASTWYPFFATHLPRVLGVAMFALCGAAFANAGLALTAFALSAVGGLLGVTLLERFAPSVLMLPRFALPAATDDPDMNASLDYAARRLGSAIIACALGLVVLLPPSGAWDDTARGLYLLRIAAWLCLVSTWFFYLFVYYRREVRVAAGRPHHFEAFDVDDDVLLRARLRRQLAIATVITTTLLLLFAYVPVPVGRAIGPVWILSLVVANAVFFGSVAVWANARFRVPIVRLAIAAAFLFSMWNDNHRVRTMADESSVKAVEPPRVTAAAQLDQWVAARGAANSKPIVPMILVAASGGGLRAAYWTALSLAAAEDRDSSFVPHLFAISSVSGGSLGGAMFTAVARDAGRSRTKLPCADTAQAHSYTTCVKDFMGDDFLSPLLAKMVAPDMLQRFLPWPIMAFDRSRGLEDSWDDSYEHTVARPTMHEGLLSLSGDSASRVSMPTLFLNSTHVETGRRYVASPVIVTNVLQDSPDVLQLLHADLPLFAAVHNSARFTIVSPAGHLVSPTSEGVELGHVVDGGYFENSGLVTLQEVLGLIESSPQRANVRPIVLYLCNDPVSCDGEAHTAVPDSVTRTHGTWANEVMAPIRALLNTRDARGELAVAQMRYKMGFDFLELDVCGTLDVEATGGAKTSADSARLEEGRARVVSPPLGWLLSKLARDWMDSSLAMDSTRAASPDVAPGSCRVRNTRQLQRLSKLLRKQ